MKQLDSMEVSFRENLPPENWRRLINEYALILPDTPLRLKFTRNVLKHFHNLPKRYRFYPFPSEITVREILEAEIEKLLPESNTPVKKAIQNGDISQPPFIMRKINWLRRTVLFLVLAGLILGIPTDPEISDHSGNPKNHVDTAFYPVRYPIPFHQIDYPFSFRLLESQVSDRPIEVADSDHWVESPVTVKPILFPFSFQLPENTIPFQPIDVAFSFPLLEEPVTDQPVLFPFSFRLLENPIPFQAIEVASDHLAESPDSHHLFQYPFLFTLLENQVPFQRPEGLIAIPGDFEKTALKRKPSVTETKGKFDEKGFPEYIVHPIWLVEKTAKVETYSNGLQIITSLCVDNIPRRYVAFPRDTDALPGKERLSSKIRGILYHSSEGDVVPLKPEKNRLIKKYSKQLLKYVCRKKGYHYLIDPFGRVYRIVREKDAAFHAGNSVWADKDSIYMNLNHAFIGICFEGKGFEEIYEPGAKKPKMRVLDDTTITEAQIQSGKELTDWLRFHYGIPQRNCVPHGIASVYPKNRLIGYHLDLAHGFPFHRFGLRNRYKEKIPAIIEFGFKGDRYFREVLNGNVWPGAELSEKYLEKKAKQSGLSLNAYRKKLNQRFDRYFDWQTDLHKHLTVDQPPSNHGPEGKTK